MTIEFGDPRLPLTFWAKVEVAPSGCWAWRRAKNSKGYGCFAIDGRVQLVHRIAYAALVGLIPDGLTIDHLCHERTCVRPEHLEVVTLRENVRRAHAHRRLRAAA